MGIKNRLLSFLSRFVNWAVLNSVVCKNGNGWIYWLRNQYKVHYQKDFMDEIPWGYICFLYNHWGDTEYFDIWWKALPKVAFFFLWHNFRWLRMQSPGFKAYIRRHVPGDEIIPAWRFFMPGDW